MTANHPPLILASGSVYRRQLIARLGLDVHCDPPDIDESTHSGEFPEQLAARLSAEKAAAVAQRHPDSLIIASDQVAELHGTGLGKPGSAERAQEQLRRCSGQQVNFHTGLCLLNTTTGRQQIAVETFSVKFRELSEQQIKNYVQREPALDCAGSFKAEGLGVALFEAMSGTDPNTLIGLPLIRLVDFLENEGYPVL